MSLEFWGAGTAGTLRPIWVAEELSLKYFQKYEIERSFSKMFATMLFKAHKIFPALIRGYIPTRIKGYFDIAVTDVLINEEGVVDEVYYAKKDVADHFPFDKVKEFSLS